MRPIRELDSGGGGGEGADDADVHLSALHQWATRFIQSVTFITAVTPADLQQQQRQLQLRQTQQQQPAATAADSEAMDVDSGAGVGASHGEQGNGAAGAAPQTTAATASSAASGRRRRYANRDGCSRCSARIHYRHHYYCHHTAGVRF